jgi:rhodanese-related sulfurtransferase
MGCCGGFSNSPSVPEVTAADVPAQLASGALLVDVREPFEWDAGHAPDARHHPFSTIPAIADSLPRDRTIVVVCHYGNRSATTTLFLREQALDAVNLRGGMLAWEIAGLPIVDPHGQQGTVT